jgi:hypothetical protein
MENTPSFSNTSAKMNFAISDCSAMISMSNNNPIVVYFCMLQDTYMHKMVASGNQFDIVSLASVAK